MRSRSSELSGPGSFSSTRTERALRGPRGEDRDFTTWAKSLAERIANNARKLVTDAGRALISFDHVKTRNRAQR